MPDATQLNPLVRRRGKPMTTINAPAPRVQTIVVDGKLERRAVMDGQSEAAAAARHADKIAKGKPVK